MLFSFCNRAKELFRRRGIQDTEIDYGRAKEDDFIDVNSQLLWVERTCDSLRRNDRHVETIEFDATKRDLDDNCFLEICNALKKNDVVSNLVFRQAEMNENSIDQLSLMLRRNGSISTLLLEDMDEGVVAAVVSTLSTDNRSSIRVVNLKGICITGVVAEAIGAMVKMNESLIELRLCHCHVDEKGASVVAEGLKQNSTLRVLDFVGNNFGDRAVSAISSALRYHPAVEFLCLDFNDFGDVGIGAISSMLCENRSLRELHLFGNKINSSGAEKLSEALHYNSTLQTLILSFNRIGDRGATALAKALTENNSLKKVWFPSNGVGVDGFQAFGEMLPLMDSLEKLHIGDFFDRAAAEALLEGLKFNTKLSALYMESPVCEEGCMESKIDFYLRLNRSGRSLLLNDDAPASLWANALEKANQNQSEEGSPDIMFHMLREKPDLLLSAR